MSKLIKIGTKKQWNLLIEEAKAKRLVEVTNLNLNKQQLKALGKERKIRLLYSGPFIWM